MNTKQRHTPGPWTVEMPEPFCLKIKDGDGHIVADVWMDDALQSHDDFNLLVKANAARIVACVNACEGLDEGDLSRIHATVGELWAIERQRDELAAALREVLAVSANREAFVMLGPRAFIKAENIARAALAKLDK